LPKQSAIAAIRDCRNPWLTQFLILYNFCHLSVIEQILLVWLLTFNRISNILLSNKMFINEYIVH
jgi:hypothetical protein